MSVEVVHPVGPDVLDAMTPAAVRAYLGDPDAGGAASRAWRRRFVDPARCWAALDRGRVVGTLLTLADTVSVPAAGGGAHPALAADLLSLVSVAATHRRRGLLRAMLDASLTEAHDRGDAVSVLVAAEWAIYGRFGYAPAVMEAHFDLDRRRQGARLRASEVVGGLYEVDAAEAAEHAPPVYEAEARRRAGVIGRDELWWDRALRRLGPGREVVPLPGQKPPRHVLHEAPDGRVDGYLRWHVETDDLDGVGGALTVDELLAATPAALAELYRLLLGVDLVSRVEVRSRPVDDPLPWLLVDGRAANPRLGDAMWLRILDVPAALSARGYDVADTVTVEVVDPAVGGWAGGRWTLVADPAGAEVRAAGGRSADVTLPASTLSAIYLGGVRAATLALVGGLDEHTPGAAARLDRLFATPLAPWRATDF